MAITWLSSYPKSGNTWVRFMIANMLAGPLDSTEHLQAIVPDMHEPLSAVQRRRWAAMPRQVTKTHHVYREGEPYQGRTAGIISVVRNPLDVLASGMNFRLLTRPGQQRAAEGDGGAARRGYVDVDLRAGGARAGVAPRRCGSPRSSCSNIWPQEGRSSRRICRCCGKSSRTT